MKSADLIVEADFPVTTALFAKQLNQNGVTAPLVMSAAGQYVVGGLAPAAALTKAVYFHPCDAPARDTPQAKAYVQAYQAKFPSDNVVATNPFFYDAVNFLAAAIHKVGGNLDSGAIVNAIPGVSTDGVCGTVHSDSEHNLMHTAEIISAPTGKAVATYDNLPSS
jgi:ABC-type branched-subunit amino acid transport system substrate-binding protein